MEEKMPMCKADIRKLREIIIDKLIIIIMYNST